MKASDIVDNATFMPFAAPPCSNGPYEFFDHVIAPVSKLSVLQIIKTSHMITLSLALGKRAVDYLADANPRPDSNFQ